MHNFRLFPVLCATVLLGGCGTLVSGQTQDVTLLTPGATEAKCTFDNGIRYVISTGETLSIMRNESDIVVDCYAAGNRHRTMNIEAGPNGWALGDIVTGVVPGVTFDHFAKGLYDYPETITVDFTGMPTGFDLPGYDSEGAPNPRDQGIESYAPSTPRLDNEQGAAPEPLQKKNNTATASPFGGATSNSVSGQSVTPMPGTTSSYTGTVVQTTPAPAPVVPQGSSAEELNRSANPTVFRN